MTEADGGVQGLHTVNTGNDRRQADAGIDSDARGENL